MAYTWPPVTLFVVGAAALSQALLQFLPLLHTALPQLCYSVLLGLPLVLTFLTPFPCAPCMPLAYTSETHPWNCCKQLRNFNIYSQLTRQPHFSFKLETSYR